MALDEMNQVLFLCSNPYYSWWIVDNWDL